VVPRILGPRTSLEIFAEARVEEVEDTLVEGVESWVQLTFPLGRRTKARGYAAWREFNEKPIGDVSASALARRAEIPVLGWQMAFDSREQAFGARRGDGLFAGIDLLGSSESLGSDVSLLGVFGQLKLFGWPGRDRPSGGAVTWAQSFRGAILEPYGGTEIPTSERLRAGGSYSVRGYRTESLGPLDAEGNALGGEVLFVVNQELRFPLRRDGLSGLLFFDAGNVWESRESIGSGLFKSVGLGLRALTPAGPLRFDVAFPLDRREGDDHVKAYFGFGHVF